MATKKRNSIKPAGAARKKATAASSKKAIAAYYAAVQSAEEKYLSTPEGDAERLKRNAERLKRNAERARKNPVTIVRPGPERKQHYDLPHLFPQGGGAYMIEFWHGTCWRTAHLGLSMDDCKKWLDYQGYKKAVIVK